LKDSGNAKVYRVNLSTGFSVDATAEHRFKVLNTKHEFEWKSVKRIEVGDYIVQSVGGKFPKRLPLDYKYDRPQTLIENTIDYLLENVDTAVTIADIFNNVSGYSSANAVTAKTSCLVRSNLVSKKKFGSRSPSVYTVVDSEALLEFKSECRGGKINSNRDQIEFPKYMTEDLAKLIGYLIADGNYAQNGPEVSFTSTSKKKIRDFTKSFETVFSCKCRVSNWVTKDGTKAQSAVFAYNEIKNFLAHIGLTAAWSCIKTIPWSILQAPRNCAVAFVNAAFSCDGGVSAKGLYYASTSTKLLSQMQVLLMRLGGVFLPVLTVENSAKDSSNCNKVCGFNKPSQLSNTDAKPGRMSSRRSVLCQGPQSFTRALMAP
jgi:intein/homing endonuclease